MYLYQHHRRKLIWLHWVADSTAGAGTTVAAWRGMSSLVWPASRDAVLISPHIALIFLWFLLLICMAATAGTQQVILQQVGLSKNWVTSTIVGVIFGVFAGFLCAVVYASFHFFGIRNALLIRSSVLFACWAGLGFVQSRGFATNWSKRCVWILVNGCFPLLVIALALARGFVSSGPIQIGLCLGMLYGVVTGTCLAWMAPASEAEAGTR